MEPQRRYTRRYEAYIYALSQKGDFTIVAALEGLTFDIVPGIFERQATVETKAVLQGCRWLVVKQRENLSVQEQARFPELYAASPELRLCYELKDEFRTIFDLQDRQEAQL